MRATSWVFLVRLLMGSLSAFDRRGHSGERTLGLIDRQRLARNDNALTVKLIFQLFRYHFFGPW
jgi:hypothetical protein